MERGLSSTSAPNQGSISRRFLSTAIIICLFISFFPSVAADDDWSTANVLTDALPVHVTVVIPTRNEEAAIVDTIRSVPNDGWCEKLDFLIIDGNSTDKTRELAEQEGATVYLEPRKGYGRAYRTGFAMAPGEIIVTMDADCTYPGEEVPRLVKKLIEEYLSWITCDR